MTEHVQKDIENRLETTFHIRTTLEDLPEFKRLCIISSLLQTYDSSWQVESFPSLIGNFSNAFKAVANEEETSANNYSKKDLAVLKRWITVMGVGYLIPNWSTLSDVKKFSHLCTTLMDKIEQRHGSRLKPIIRQVIGKQSRMTIKNVAENMRLNQDLDSTSASTTSVKTAEENIENPFQGRSIPRTANEIPEGKKLPRTPLKDKDEENITIPKGKSIPSSPSHRNEEENVEHLKVPDQVEPPKNFIPSGKNEIPRTPQIGQKDDVFVIPEVEKAGKGQKDLNLIPSGKNEIPRTPSVPSDNEDHEKAGLKGVKNIIPSGKNEIPRTPSVTSDNEDQEKVKKANENPQKVIKNVIPSGKNEIPRTPSHSLANEGQNIIKEPMKSPKTTNKNPMNEEPKKETFKSPKGKKNMIPVGENVLPRTPFHLSSSENASSLRKVELDAEIKGKKNYIPSGRGIPRTPFIESKKDESSTKLDLEGSKAAKRPHNLDLSKSIKELVNEKNNIRDESLQENEGRGKRSRRGQSSQENIEGERPLNRSKRGKKEVESVENSLEISARRSKRGQKKEAEKPVKKDQEEEEFESSSRETSGKRRAQKIEIEKPEKRSKRVTRNSDENLVEKVGKAEESEGELQKDSRESSGKQNELENEKDSVPHEKVTRKGNRARKSNEEVNESSSRESSGKRGNKGQQVTNEKPSKRAKKVVKAPEESLGLSSRESSVSSSKNDIETPKENVQSKPSRKAKKDKKEPTSETSSRENSVKDGLKQNYVEIGEKIEEENPSKKTKKGQKSSSRENSVKHIETQEDKEQEENAIKKTKKGQKSSSHENSAKDIESQEDKEENPSKKTRKGQKSRDQSPETSRENSAKKKRQNSKEKEDPENKKKKVEKVVGKKSVREKTALEASLRPTKDELPSRRRRSPRLQQEEHEKKDDNDREELKNITSNDEETSCSTKQDGRHQSTTKEVVKLPQIGHKRTKRAPPRKAKELAQVVQDVTIEELVPPLKMTMNKDGSKPNERISDEIYSTPLVKNVNKVKATRRTKKEPKAAQIFALEDEIYQTPRRHRK